jgi:uncharacterized protein (DUF58 family)
VTTASLSQATGSVETAWSDRVTDLWYGPGGRTRRRRAPFRWSRLLWSLIIPPKGHRILPTASGVVLIALALAIGTAAYNTGSNILFITLSLLLACLILSGVLSATNFARVAWRLTAAPPFRVGQEATLAVEVRNGKRLLPTYALWFEVGARHTADERRLLQRQRLDPGGTCRIEWTLRPARRGREVVELAAVGSLFPFGFLQKSLGTDARHELLVWPERVAYTFGGAAATRRPAELQPVRRPGMGADLLALRKYQAGDSHRLIHWKASARVRQLLVRQLASESVAAFWLLVETPAAAWPRAPQFERLCSLAASLAEDLFREGRLAGAAVNDSPPIAVRRVRDLETFLDQLATVEPRTDYRPAVGRWPHPATVTFEPEGERGVRARLGGEIAARA